MCDCLNETLNEVKNKVKDLIVNDADFSTLDINYSGRVMRFDGKKNDVMIKVNYSFFKLKKDGERAKNRTKSYINLAMSYCPICGEKYV